MLLVCVLAGAILLLALSPRALPPEHVERIERRDPLEQVDALAHAYEQVGATRTITGRLLRGLRWRVERGGSVARAASEHAFLDTIVLRDPALQGDVAVIRHALSHSVTARELPNVGAALRRIEHTLMTTVT